jgi:hypothetical protein
MAKEVIRYNRSQRHLNTSWLLWIIFMLFIVLPPLVLISLYHTELSLFVSNTVADWIRPILGENAVAVVSTEFLGDLTGVYAVRIANNLPNVKFAFYNLVGTLIAMAILVQFIKRNSVMSFFFMMMAVVHFVSSMYFWLATEFFPYTIFTFSDLYIKQQVSIWITLIAFGGFIYTFTGSTKFFDKLMFFVITLVYSFIFGIVRYFVFLILLSKLSVIYMGVMFFTLGPLFDFLYLVGIYVLYIYLSMRHLSNVKELDKWKWL